MKITKGILLAGVVGLVAYFVGTSHPKEIEAKGDQKLQIFKNEPIRFDTSIGHQTTPDENGIIRLDNGRILLKKVTLPTNYERETEVTLRMSSASAGDPWDKAGSVFLFSKESAINLLTLAEQKNELPKPTNMAEEFFGVKPDGQYIPALELMRFMTPFGIGYYSDSLQNRKPVYIPHWEKSIVWEQNVSDLIDRLDGEAYIGVWVDSWLKSGYTVDLELIYDEDEHGFVKRKNKWTAPVINSVSYMGPMQMFDYFSRNDLNVTVNIPENVENTKLRYIVTGHGGHSGGDEFVKKENVIAVDGQEVLRFTPWRDDCASFRRFNPHSGVWTEEADWKGGKIQERIASSDYSRSNWCPGTDVMPVDVDLSNLAPGEHTITFSIPNAQPIKKGEMNGWLVSAYLVGDKK